MAFMYRSRWPLGKVEVALSGLAGDLRVGEAVLP